MIQRYDRIFHNDQVERIHQEDFCQALGISYASKYQHDGGPSFVDCFNLIQRTSITPLQDVENLLRWQIFNFLAGNSDGHAKNSVAETNKEFMFELNKYPAIQRIKKIIMKQCNNILKQLV